MNIEIHIFPQSFPIDPQSWTNKFDETMERVNDFILASTVNSKSYAHTPKQTFLDDTGYVIATVQINR